MFMFGRSLLLALRHVAFYAVLSLCGSQLAGCSSDEPDGMVPLPAMSGGTPGGAMPAAGAGAMGNAGASGAPSSTAVPPTNAQPPPAMSEPTPEPDATEDPDPMIDCTPVEWANPGGVEDP